MNESGVPLTAGAPAPRVSLLLITYNQQDTIAEALAGALAQTYSPLQIIASDDASTDATWQRLQQAGAGYAGPHQLTLRRNASNLGIGAHLSALVAASDGELLVVAAGDDVSLPGRCAALVDAWCRSGQRLDLIGSALFDIDAAGEQHGVIVPSLLQEWRTLDDWALRPPHVVGAAQAWTRRVFERFGPLPPGTVAEDLIMVFRALAGGGALVLAEPLVRYRRGGLSSARRALHARDVVRRLLANNRHALVETEQLRRDAALAGAGPVVHGVLDAKLARERFVAALFAKRGVAGRIAVAVGARDVPVALRIRWWCYAAVPWALAPWFALKRLVARRRR